MEIGTVCAGSGLSVFLNHAWERWHQMVLPTKMSLCWRSELERRLLCSTISRLFVSPSLPPPPCPGVQSGTAGPCCALPRTAAAVASVMLHRSRLQSRRDLLLLCKKRINLDIQDLGAAGKGSREHCT